MAPPTAHAQGVLPMPAAALQKKPTINGAPTVPPAKPKASRLKVVIRRLPPGLTQAEFDDYIGDEWKAGGGRVDWYSYRAGKVSRDLAKPSRPSRAYLHLTDPIHLDLLADKVRQTSLLDAKGSSKDGALIGPPSCEFAPYNRIPNVKPRNDARQGQIDQDPEFQAFLEQLTNPIAKPAPAEDADSKEKEKIKTTPLVEYLREKKAQKDKPPTKVPPKHGRQESKDVKGDKAADKKAVKSGKDVQPAPEKGKKGVKGVTQKIAAEEAARALNKQAAAVTQPAQPPAPPTAPAAERKRTRGDASAVKSMLQRDLGIAPAGGRRGSRREQTSDTVAAAAAKGESAPLTTVPQEAASASTTSPLPPSSPRAKDKGRPSRSDRRNANAKSALSEKTNDATPTDSKSLENQAAAAPTILRKPPTAPAAQQPPKGPSAASRATPPTEPNYSPPTVPTPPASSSSTPTPAAQAAPANTRPTPNIQVTTRHAFLKHANPSQGITEPLIHAALSVFGPLEKVTIDTKKGFAYVDFADTEGLRKAIAGSPIKVARGAVQVLEKKDRGAAKPVSVPGGPPMGGMRGGGPSGGFGPGFRGGRGGMGNRGGRGGGPVGGVGRVAMGVSPAASPVPANVAPPATASTPAEATGSSPVPIQTPASATPASAPAPASSETAP